MPKFVVDPQQSCLSKCKSGSGWCGSASLTYNEYADMLVCHIITRNVIILHAFNHKPKYYTHLDLMVKKIKGSEIIIILCPVGTMNVCAKIHGNTSNIYQDILVWIKVVD